MRCTFTLSAPKGRPARSLPRSAQRVACRPTAPDALRIAIEHRPRRTSRRAKRNGSAASSATAGAPAVLALGVLGALVAAVFAGQQVREARRSREAHMAAEFFRRWNEDALLETRRMVAGFGDADALATAFKAYVDANAP